MPQYSYEEVDRAEAARSARGDTYEAHAIPGRVAGCAQQLREIARSIEDGNAADLYWGAGLLGALKLEIEQLAFQLNHVECEKAEPHG
jgi:hypothetical protein